jgi:hypothetical protein
MTPPLQMDAGATEKIGVLHLIASKKST